MRRVVVNEQTWDAVIEALSFYSRSDTYLSADPESPSRLFEEDMDVVVGGEFEFVPGARARTALARVANEPVSQLS